MMKAATHPSVISTTIIVLALLSAAVVMAGLSGWSLPVLSDLRLDIVLVVVLGIAICTQGGVGRIAARGEWAHPFSILGYLLGSLILLITLAVFTGWKLPWIQDDRQALLAITVLVVLKFANAGAHSRLERT
jgi:hypothetical protein